ncbi:thiamine phosphate synthase [Olivibacter sp. SDN3]|uniref:thiamine phosphate synthase n=1 Tax=Olivibacter sp. SDN3 TaxID=2764720 RepID=UPI001651693D|nr:thiamine phosphate synthase [Olivibacter sp. SDN3]QNL51196.1 thiamine phosphate synthase [Olivibacter sp. SDN3]
MIRNTSVVAAIKAIRLVKIVLITSENPVQKEQETINDLFVAGLQLLHIRKPYMSFPDIRNFILRINERFYDKIVVHNHPGLQQEFNLAGVHLKPTVFEKTPVTANILSTSSHSISAFQRLDKKNSHIFLSPVFDSLSKAGYQGKPELLKAGTIPRQGKLIALGGITAENIAQVANRGFDGAALLGYIWQGEAPLKNFYKLKEQIS